MIKQIIVMPAWIAGIQVRKDASGNIHVNLDSSTPCWNDAIEGVLHKLTEVLHRYFQRRVEEHEVGKIGLLKILLYVLCALCG
jgi:hypothetical protein